MLSSSYPLILAALFATPAPPSGGTAEKNGCEYCHSKMKVELHGSVHRSSDLRCTTCHGGDANQFDQAKAHDRAKGWKGKLRGRELVQACTRCHADVRRMRAYRLPADQLLEYRTGAHARSVLRPGPPGSATCTDCHGSHDIRPAQDAEAKTYRARIAKTCARCHADAKLMKRHGLPWDTYEKYQRGIHGRLQAQGNLKSPTCHDCHGNHGVTAYRAKQVAFVCGNCHRVTRNHFMQGPHFKAFASRKTGECSTCHGHHDVQLPTYELLVSSSRGGCLQGGCHGKKTGDAGAKVARKLHALITDYQQALRRTEHRVVAAERAGFEVGVSQGYIKEAKRIREQLGPLLHRADVRTIERELNRGRGYLTEALETLDVKLRAYRDRRIIAVGVLAALGILLMLLFIKYRRLTRRPGNGS